jgi:hypothetical protein
LDAPSNREIVSPSNKFSSRLAKPKFCTRRCLCTRRCTNQTDPNSRANTQNCRTATGNACIVYCACSDAVPRHFRKDESRRAGRIRNIRGYAHEGYINIRPYWQLIYNSGESYLKRTYKPMAYGPLNQYLQHVCFDG